MAEESSALATSTKTPLPPAAKAAADAAVQSAIEKMAQTESSPSSYEEGKEEEGEVQTISIEGGLKKDITVFDSRQEFTVKHPLATTWTLWFDSASKQDKAKSWDEALVKIMDFDSVEEFWGLYNNIVPPSAIHPNSNYYLFKEGIRPAWEDKANAIGGKWSVQLPRGKFTDSIDSFWLNTMLAAVGETFETPFTNPSDSTSPAPAPPSEPLSSTFANDVTGVIVSARKAFYRINIWTRTSDSVSKERVLNVGRQFKYGVLGMDASLSFKDSDKVSTDVEFVSHSDSQAKYGAKIDKWLV